MSQTKNKQIIRTLVECALMIALATVLSLIKIVKLPYGGSVTPVSMLPIALIANKYGNKIGLATAFGYALIQLFMDLGEVISWGMTPVMLVACLFLDYLIAYTALGFAGTFRKYKYWGILAGIGLAFALRFLSHFISGWVIFGEYCTDYGFTQPWLYSLVYNGTYMGIELIASMAVAFALFRIPVINKLIGNPELAEDDASQEDDSDDFQDAD